MQKKRTHVAELKIRGRPGSARSGTEEAALRALLAQGRTARPGRERQRSGGVGYRPPAAPFPHPHPASWRPRPPPPTDPSLPLAHIRLRKPTSRHGRPPARLSPSRRAKHPRPAVGEGSGGQSLTLKMAPAPPSPGLLTSARSGTRSCAPQGTELHLTECPRWRGGGAIVSGR